MRVPIVAALAAAATVIVSGQAPGDARLQAQLQQLFPAAVAFSPKTGEPPHFKAFARDQTLAGLAFWTTEIEPLERGFEGPIRILVGMDPTGLLTGIVIAQHNEPYGHFSIDPPAFAARFRGKSIRDPFRVGADIDAVSRATITMTSATRAVKNSARRVARQYLTPAR